MCGGFCFDYGDFSHPCGPMSGEDTGSVQATLMFLGFLRVGRNGDSHLAGARLQVLDWDLFLSW